MRQYDLNTGGVRIVAFPTIISQEDTGLRRIGLLDEIKRPRLGSCNHLSAVPFMSIEVDRYQGRMSFYKKMKGDFLFCVKRGRAKRRKKSEFSRILVSWDAVLGGYFLCFGGSTMRLATRARISR
jgi:hypothetical protein